MQSESVIEECRTCLSQNEALVSIYNEYLDKIYSELTAIQILDDDNLPKKVCLSCAKRLRDVKSFRDLCVESHRILNDKLKWTDPSPEYTIVSFMDVEPEGTLQDKKKLGQSTDETTVPEKKSRTSLKCPHPSCTQIFFKQDRLDSHLRTHAGEKPEICEVCGKGFSSYKNLKRHLDIHSDVKRFKCKFCEKTFRSSNNLKVHENGMHTKETTYVCHICGLSFVNATGLIIHQKRHSNEKKYQCNECPRLYKTRSELKDHLIRHKGIRDVICPICQATFLVKKDLKFHQRQVHDPRRDFACNKCEKKYKKKWQLDAHLRTHTGERPFVCTFCDKGFYKKFTLVKHTYSHTGEKPFKCTKCPKAYTEIFILKRHMRQQHSEVAV